MYKINVISNLKRLMRKIYIFEQFIFKPSRIKFFIDKNVKTNFYDVFFNNTPKRVMYGPTGTDFFAETEPGFEFIKGSGLSRTMTKTEIYIKKGYDKTKP